MTKTPTMHRHLDRDISVTLGNLHTPALGEEIQPFDQLKPERNLIAAILARAIEDAQGTSLETSMSNRRNAREWIKQDTPNKPFTFSWCCTILDLEPFEIRRILKANRYRFEAFRPDRNMAA